MLEYNNLDSRASYQSLVHSLAIDKVSLTRDRIMNYQARMAEGLVFNYAAKLIDGPRIELLCALAREQQCVEKYCAVCRGEIMNPSERRMVLHHLTRGPVLDIYPSNHRDFYDKQRSAMALFAKAVRDKAILAPNGKPFQHVAQIGIGGSHLGPCFLYNALHGWARQKNIEPMLNVDFISNVDPDNAARVLENIDVTATLFIVVSKSGSTQETAANMDLISSILKESGIERTNGHFALVTSKGSKLDRSGDYLITLYIDEHVGGRYSSTSAVGGLLLSLAFGPEVFDEILQGAHQSDLAALEPDPLKNAALLDALIGVDEICVRHCIGSAILPYSDALSMFPAHLQQLDMESNGKSVNRFEEPISYPTGTLIFGASGTNGQHSFYQLLHQGKIIIPLQFIGFRLGQSERDLKISGSSGQEKLQANLIAQIVAFAHGRDEKNKNIHFAGGRPSSLIYGDQVTPRSLGALLAHYENKVMFQGFLWNINSFDQPGVELGKTMANKLLTAREDQSMDSYIALLRGNNA